MSHGPGAYPAFLRPSPARSAWPTAWDQLSAWAWSRTWTTSRHGQPRGPARRPARPMHPPRGRDRVGARPAFARWLASGVTAERSCGRRTYRGGCLPRLVRSPAHVTEADQAANAARLGGSSPGLLRSSAAHSDLGGQRVDPPGRRRCVAVALALGRGLPGAGVGGLGRDGPRRRVTLAYLLRCCVASQ
jgi:hypothetical protein